MRLSQLRDPLTRLSHPTRLPVWLGLATVSAGFYLLMARLIFGVDGFPLDDAWIHQTYARNLGLRGEFSFTPGVPSTGSTAPLWSLLLSLGYLLGIPFAWWTHLLGTICLALSGFVMARLGQQLFSQQSWLGPLVGLSLLFEWHLVWAAVSGMETSLFVLGCLFLVERHVAWYRNPIWQRYAILGILGGMVMLTRPEGLGLLGLLGLADLLRWGRNAQKQRTWQPLLKGIRVWLAAAATLMLVVGPYLWFNYQTSGLLLPNTFYAKQQEYAILLRAQSLWQRSGQVLGVTLIGGQALLVPGLIVALWHLFRKANIHLTVLAVWWLSMLALYAIRLPVVYQHGRYQMPTIPWLLLLGIWGTVLWVRWYAPSLTQRVLNRGFVWSLGLSLIVFWIVGAFTYARDVRIIDTEMVATAQWLQENTSPQTIIAAHDIGAIGYFTERHLVDLAGLITPEVIPFIRDEARLLSFSRAEGATYLVTFPSWYPNISSQLPLIFQTDTPYAPQAGGDNMAVYRLSPE